jgi:hypothetical protein
MGIPPTAKKSAGQGITISRISNGKFVEQWPSWDTLRFLQSLGIVPQLGPSDSRADTTRDARPH